MSKKELTIVVVTYSFDPEINVHVFDDYQSACNFIKEDFHSIAGNQEVDVLIDALLNAVLVFGQGFDTIKNK